MPVTAARVVKAVQKVSSAPAFARIAPHVVPALDRAVHRLTRGKVLLSAQLLPGVVLSVRGAKSGQLRRTPLACMPEGAGEGEGGGKRRGRGAAVAGCSSGPTSGVPVTPPGPPTSSPIRTPRSTGKGRTSRSRPGCWRARSGTPPGRHCWRSGRRTRRTRRGWSGRYGSSGSYGAEHPRVGEPKAEHPQAGNLLLTRDRRWSTGVNHRLRDRTWA